MQTWAGSLYGCTTSRQREETLVGTRESSSRISLFQRSSSIHLSKGVPWMPKDPPSSPVGQRRIPNSPGAPRTQPAVPLTGSTRHSPRGGGVLPGL